MALLEPGQPVKRWLLGLANLYSVIVKFRMWLYRREWLRSSRLPCRVISVGNMTVGGTGKTAVVMLLVKWLQEEGQRVAVLSRGYKRAGSAAHLLVSDGTRLLAGPIESGDEPFLIARHCPQAIVAVGSDRSALGRWVLEQFPVDCIVLDDGFQHLGYSEMWIWCSLMRPMQRVWMPWCRPGGFENRSVGLGVRPALW